jgi:predicted metal-dependent enzyme (double-stranded beta helix superfamily)
VINRKESIDEIVQLLYVRQWYKGCTTEGVAMFETDAFLEDCVAATREAEPRRAIKEVLERAVADPAAIARALPPQRSGITKLLESPELTVLHVVWAPGMSFGPHDHRMWAAIGIYSGGEDNSFYRRQGDTLVASGGTRLEPRDVTLLGGDTIHAVANPTGEFAGAIHVYGGNLFATERSEWRGEPFREQPYDSDHVLRYFEEANRTHVAG